MDEKAPVRPLAERENHEYLDVLRCISAYLVVLSHCLSFVEEDPSLVGTRLWWLCDVMNILAHMGLSVFFMISGFLLLSDSRTLNVGAFYRRRLSKLLPPFLIWNVIYYLQHCYIDGHPPDIDRFFFEFAGQGSEVHLWYVYQIVGLYLLMPFLKRIVDHCSTKELLVLLTVVLFQPTILRCVNIIQSYVWIAPFQALVEGYVGFLLLGYLLGTRELSPKTRGWIYGLGLFAVVVGTWGNYHFSADAQVALPFNEGYFITQYMTGAAFFLLAKQTAHKLPKLIRRLTGELYKLSYGIYLSHMFILEWCWYAASKGWCSELPLAQQILIRFLVAAAGSTALNWVFLQVPGLKKYLL